MKKLYFIMLLLFFFFSFSITAQTMQVQGHLLGDEKQDLESATVRCYTSDTIFVAGVTTNMKGLFTLRLPPERAKIPTAVQLSRLQGDDIDLISDKRIFRTFGRYPVG